MNNNSSVPENSFKFTRRDFLRTTSTAAIGGTIVGSLAGKVFAASNEDTLKIALIGCGGRGSGAADQALSTTGKTKLVAVVDAFADKLQNSLGHLKKQHGEKVDVPEAHQFVGFDGYKQAIALADVVILATPPGFRPIHFEEAVRQGKHVFMEKPVAVDAPGVRRVLAAAEEAKKKNLKVGVGLQRHHQLGYLETVKRLQDGEIGDIVSARCYWNGGGVWVRPREAGQSEMQYQMRNWYYFNWLCGDHINEQHIHNLDVINWVKQAYPVRCHGLGGRQVRTGIDHGEIFDHHAVEYEYADGTHMFSQCQHIQGCWSSVSEHVVGTKGNSDISAHIIRGANAWKMKKEGARDAYQQESCRKSGVNAAAVHRKPRQSCNREIREIRERGRERSPLSRGSRISWLQLRWSSAVSVDHASEKMDFRQRNAPDVPRDCFLPAQTNASSPDQTAKTQMVTMIWSKRRKCSWENCRNVIGTDGTMIVPKTSAHF